MIQLIKHREYRRVSTVYISIVRGSLGGAQNTLDYSRGGILS